jgi:transposase
MAKRREKRVRRSVVVELDAAGIDIGAEEIYVAVPPDRDEESTRRFSSFTGDLHALADWLGRCRIRTVAMESTGVFWIPLFQILEKRGFQVYLVNAHYLKSVPGRKSDVSDCEWIQYLHSVGLLRASFRPPDAICALRTWWRHRGSLLEMAAEHIQHMQKTLSQMNLQLHQYARQELETTRHCQRGDFSATRQQPLFMLPKDRNAPEEVRRAARGPLALAYVQVGRFREAIAEAKAAYEMDNSPLMASYRAGSMPMPDAVARRERCWVRSTKSPKNGIPARMKWL